MNEPDRTTEFMPSGWVDSVRRRTAMYVGDTGSFGLHYMLDDILTHSLASGLARSIVVELSIDGRVDISVDGPGFPHPLERCMTTPPCPDHGKHTDNERIWAFAVANALSEQSSVAALVGGKRFSQAYRAGIPVGPKIETQGPIPFSISMTFTPDRTFFSEARYCADNLRNRLEEFAFLHSGVKIALSDASAATNDVFHFDDGIRAFVERLNQPRTPLHDIVVIRAEADGIRFEVGIQFCKEPDELIRAYANDHWNFAEGTHVTGVRVGLTRALKRVTRMKVQTPKWSSRDRGLTAVISVRMESPQFLGSMREKLGNPEVLRLIGAKTAASLTEYFLTKPDALNAIVDGN